MNLACLIDATYKTTVYDLPLFFLCVLTNTGYVNVATFLLSDERQESIAEALRQMVLPEKFTTSPNRLLHVTNLPFTI